MSKWKFLLYQLTAKLWIRAALYAFLGVTVALVAALFAPLVPKSLAKPFGGGTVTGLLNVLASSLLAVATFSVAAMLTAFSNVSGGATPRAASLVAGDRHAQGAVATFVGAFLYAVVAYSAVGTGYYGEGGRAILFFVTLLILALVAVTLLRWVDQLLRLARVDNVIVAVEVETAKALDGVFGARPSNHGPECDAAESISVCANEVGYVQNVDINALRKLSGHMDLHIWVRAVPGAFTVPGTPLATACGNFDARTSSRIRRTFALGPDRSFYQDPQFGFIVLSEVGSHALSAAMNNHGIAKDAITSVVRLLSRWMELRNGCSAPAAGRVYWSNAEFKDILDDALLPISRDGATTLTVAVRLQNVLAALSATASDSDRKVLARFAREALERSEAGIDHEPDRVRVRAAAGYLADSGRPADPRVIGDSQSATAKPA